MSPASSRGRRLGATALAFATVIVSLFSANSALAAEGFGAGLGDGTEEKPPHLGDRCFLPLAATAAKVIAVKGTGGAEATVTTCEKWDGDYYSAMSVNGHVGYNGIASAGSKREGDGMTPSGVYRMGYGFGVKMEPTQFHGSKYVQVTQDDVWVDGDTVKNYNTMQKKSEGYTGESMFQSPAYSHGQVIDYNSAAVPGMGSAIFLHVNTGSGKTAGCVSVAEPNLLKILDWEDGSAVEMAISR